jgi:TM2 domain-containing membrane protein YozV
LQMIDPFRFSKHLRASGQFTAEQADALAEALADSFAAAEAARQQAEEDFWPSRETRPREPEHDKTTAALLAIFLGAFGAHKFYLGQTGRGFLYLIFCWSLVPAVLGFIEGLIYLSHSRDEFAEKYG